MRINFRIITTAFFVVNYLGVGEVSAAKNTLSTNTKPAAGFTLGVRVPDGYEWAEISRDIAAERLGEYPELRYVIVGEKGKELSNPKIDAFNLKRWQGLQPGGRLAFLSKFYYANTRHKSNRGNQIVACFMGRATDVITQFFNQDVGFNRIKDVSEILASFSADGLMMGMDVKIDAGADAGHKFFRMEHCSKSGKASMLPEAATQQTADNKSKDANNADRVPASPPAPPMRQQYSKSDAHEGFRMNDSLIQTAATAKLPTFKFKGDFDAAAKRDDYKKRPWKGMDLSDSVEAQKFTILMLAYFYSGMATQDKANVDNNFIAGNDKLNYWCHMPWLNQGPSQREAIHGMTMERPLATSPMYPNATRGADWGVGYYNAPGCQTIGEIFGPESNPKTIPQWTKGVWWKDGTVSVKTLFTTAKFAALEGSFMRHANVAGANETEREVQPVSMIQIDIAVKDASLKGVNPAINNWMMTTYYYDASYDLKKHAKDLGYSAVIDPLIAHIPAHMRSILKMRPIGVQTGLGLPATGESVVFEGAQTNQLEGRVNGPADNPKSSCLGCHATAGTGIAMSPGIQSNEELIPFVKDARRYMDFSQQLALAKRNYETRPAN